MYAAHSHTSSLNANKPTHPAPLTGTRSHRIGLFDSGVGGLSVLRALQKTIPAAEYIYLGDTARLPYGQRSPKAIAEFSMQASQFLHDAGANTIVIACNTASSVALGHLQRAFTTTSIRGVVEAGARAAVTASSAERIAVIGTTCTVNSGAYEEAIAQFAPRAEVHSRACPFLVSLAEEGWTDCDIAHMAVNKYIAPLMEEFSPGGPDCIILGCTHFSQFSNVIRQLLPTGVAIIDPAYALAQELAATLPRNSPLKNPSKPVAFYATDALHRFSRVGELFLGDRIPLKSLHRAALDNL